MSRISRIPTWRLGFLVGAAVTATAVGGLAWLERGQSERRREDLARESRVAARQVASRIVGALERHFVGLEQMANFWENAREVSEDEFYAFASGTLSLTPLCRRLSALDPDFRIRWIYPPGPNRGFVGFDVRSHPEGHATLARARDERQTVLSPPLRLLDGEPGFILATPVFKDNAFEAALVCVFPTQAFFRSITLPEVTGRYREVVLDADTVLFASEPGASADSPEDASAAERVRFGGRSWRLAIGPRPEVIAERLNSGRLAFWSFGLVVALLAGAAGGGLAERALRTLTRLRTQEVALEQTQRRLDGAIEQLLQAEKLAALGELVAGVAHEINNPLASVLGYTQLALRRDPPERIRRYLVTAASEAERAGRIVRNLLTFARKHPPEKSWHSLNEIVEKTLDLKAYHFRTSQIRLEQDLDPELPQTMLDGHQIQQVLLNLLNNAEQALAERGRGGRIRVATRRRGDFLELVVEDDGPGIPLEIQTRIFEPFFTTKQEGRGTGLGLSLCHGIVQEHGGSIRVESRPGEGARFFVTLPVLEAPESAAGRDAEAVAMLPSGLKILVVDDEAAIQEFLCDLLRGRGHVVEVASDVPEAVRRIASAELFDVIISDMKMPHGSGEDILEAAMRRSPQLARRIVFTTGDGTSSRAERLSRENGVPVLLKPCKIEDLDRAIAAAVRS